MATGSKLHFTGMFIKMKAKPVAFISAISMAMFGLVNIIISLFTLSFYIGFSGTYGLILGIAKLYALVQYGAIQNFENKQGIKETEYVVAKRLAHTTAILSFLHFSFAIVCTFFYDVPPKSYEQIFILYFAASAIANIIVTTADAIRTRKNRSIIIHHLKLIGLANALISLSVTQRIILFYTEHGLAKTISGIGGIFFSVAAAIVCLLMYKKSTRHLIYLN